ncbi:MAG: PPC domain-containing protein [Chloroflexota bacterium]|nr:PPC domain-containing protein [Chloroflexota bacterium]
MLSIASSPLAARIGQRSLAVALVAIALVGGLLVLEAPHLASAQEECEATDLGTIGPENNQLTTEGRWTTEDCDSAFRSGSDAHSYSFQVEEAGRVRIDLLSSEADSYLYLLGDTGDRIADNDDGAAGVNARIERDLEPGAYRIEATTVGGRGRGPADFSLTVGYVEGCETIPLGVLTAEADLTATGVWTVDTCGSRIEPNHPAYSYSFMLPASGRVRIDLTSEHGDPVLSLASPAGVIGANDDGGPGRNSRIEKYLPAGVYLIEATTYLQADRQPLVADFELTVHLVDEVAAQHSFILKVEESLAPDVVIAGEPFMVDFRVGNVGGGDLPEDWFVIVYAIGPRAYADMEIPSSETVWNAGASYHSSPELASATSTAIPSFEPIDVVLPRPGNSWVFLGVQPFQLVEDEGRYDNPGLFHGIWRNLRVVTGPIYGPVTVSVDGAAYTVEATDDEEGEVTTTVTSVADAEAEVDEGVQAKATYAAGTRELVLDGLSERPGLAGLTASDQPEAIDVPNASSTTLLRLFGEQYLEAIAIWGFDDVVANGEVINPLDVHALVLHVADKAAQQYAALSAGWTTIDERASGGGGLSFEDAFALQAELAYAERILAPIAAAGSIATQAGPGEMVPADEFDALTRQASCRAAYLGDAFEAAGVEDVEALLALDTELRASLDVFGLGSDAALCAVAGVNRENATFLRRLGISDPEIAAMNAPDRAPEPVVEATPEAPEPYRLRVIASLRADGRVEHGVELHGQHFLPPSRLLPADAPAGQWYASGEVEVEGHSIGVVRARRLADGRIELGFRDVNGDAVEPGIRFVADPPLGIFVRSSVIEVPRPEVAEEGSSE